MKKVIVLFLFAACASCDYSSDVTAQIKPIKDPCMKADTVCVSPADSRRIQRAKEAAAEIHETREKKNAEVVKLKKEKAKAEQKVKELERTICPYGITPQSPNDK